MEKFIVLQKILNLISCPRGLSLLSLGLCKALNLTTNLEIRKICHPEPGLRRAVAQVNLWRSIAAIQERCAAEEPVIVTSTGQGLEVGLLCYVHQVMADAIPEFLRLIVLSELEQVIVHPVVPEMKVCIVRVDWGGESFWDLCRK